MARHRGQGRLARHPRQQDRAGSRRSLPGDRRGYPSPTCLLDGEIARFDEQLVSRFDLLHEETGELATPPVFVAFNYHWGRGRDLRGAPLGVRLVREHVIGDRSAGPAGPGAWMLTKRGAGWVTRHNKSTSGRCTDHRIQRAD